MTKQIDRIFPAMGTVCSVTVRGDRAEAAAAAVKGRIMELHEKLNAYDPCSEISRINRNAGGPFTEVSADTLQLIKRSLRFSEQTDGVFDITTTPLSRLWKDAIKKKRLPAEQDVRRAAALANYRDVTVDGSRVLLKRPGQQIDLGAIAKGYAAEEAKRILTSYGVSDALINFGGTVVAIGKPQTVGIQDPFAGTGVPCAWVTVQNKAVVTSGLYEQGFQAGGKTYHHIVDPKTGYPSDAETAGITLVGENAEELDALSTAAFILPMGKAGKLLRSRGIDAVFITKRGNVYLTDGLMDNFRFFSKGA